jgi:prepilin-type processing-associated H-X9-DG protein
VKEERPSKGRALAIFLGVSVTWIAAVAFACDLAITMRATARRSSCSDELRQLGMAAIQYADDKRFFPHVGRMRDLDGDTTSNHATKTLRTLRWAGYHDRAEGWICPQSEDAAVTVVDPRARAWFWGGQAVGLEDRSPLWDGLPDPPLRETTELSFGWTRRGMSCGGATSTQPVAADRAVRWEGALPTAPGLVGNHATGVNAVYADGRVRWVAADDPEARRLIATGDPYDGAMAIEPPLAAPGASEGRLTPALLASDDGLLVVVLALFPPVLLGVSLLLALRAPART